MEMSTENVNTEEEESEAMDGDGNGAFNDVYSYLAYRRHPLGPHQPAMIDRP